MPPPPTSQRRSLPRRQVRPSGLASGNYGTWSGTNKAITITKQTGATPQMQISFGSGAANFTLDGMTGMGGSVSGRASNITIKNSQFTSEIDVSGSGTGRIFDGNTHNNISGNSTSNKFLVEGPVTIRNSHFEGGGSDGIRLGTSVPAGSVIIEHNVFLNIRDDGSGNHTDNIQWYGGNNAIVRGNLFKQTIDGETQVMGAFDGTSGKVIEDNVIDVTGRNWGIELYADNGSIVRHNTVVYHPANPCFFNLPCGFIDFDHKSGDPAGQNEQAYDNIATEITTNPSSAVTRRDHNMVRQNAGSGDFIGNPIFVGGTSPSTYEGYALAAGSPGKNAASDGLDVGIRVSGGGGGDTQAPSTPSNLSAPAVSSSQINLSWTASTDNVGVTGYQIYRGGTLLTTVTGTSYSNTGLTASTSYSYYVRATDAAGNVSGNSNTASATTQAGTPVPTATLSANPTSITSGQSSTLTWSSTNATSCTGTGFTAAGTSGTHIRLSDRHHHVLGHLHRRRRHLARGKRDGDRHCARPNMD